MKKEKSTKQIWTIIILLIIGGVVSYFVTEYLSKQSIIGYMGSLVGGVLMLGCLLLAALVFAKNFEIILNDEVMSIDKKYSNQSFTYLSKISPDRVQKCMEHDKFSKLDSGYWYKKVLSITKNSISFYVKNCETKDVQKTISEELDQYENIVNENENACLLLFLYSEKIAELDMQIVRECAKVFIMQESVMQGSIAQSCIVILVDSRTGAACYLDMDKKNSITIYAQGCKLLKKYFPES